MTFLADFLLTIVPKDSIPIYLKTYIPGESPLSTWPVVTTALASYLAIIFGIREIMRDRSPQRLNTLFRIHNAFLSAGSLILLVLMMEEVGSIRLTNTTYGTMCDETSWTEVRLFNLYLFDTQPSPQRLEFYYMINYYFKYIELFDTVFLALKKKPLGMRYRVVCGIHALTGHIQLSFMYFIILPLLCYALCNLTAKRVWYVHVDISASGA